jgi:hypothetical protein
LEILIKLLTATITAVASIVGMLTVILKIIFLRNQSSKDQLHLKLVQKNYGHKGNGPFHKFELRYWFEYKLINASASSITNIKIVTELSDLEISEYFRIILHSITLLPPHKEVELEGFRISSYIKPELIYNVTVEDKQTKVYPGMKVDEPSKVFEPEITKAFEIVLEYSSEGKKYYLVYKFDNGKEKLDYYKTLWALKLKFKWIKLKQRWGL